MPRVGHAAVRQEGSRPMRALRLIAVALLLSACRRYGSMVSLATPEVRLPPDELVGTWRAPEALRRGSNGEQPSTRLTWPYVLTVDTTPDGWGAADLSIVGVPDFTIAGKEPETQAFLGTLVRLGGRRILEFRVEHTGDMAVPLMAWLRLDTRGDTVFLEHLDGDSLAAWLERSPSLTPHRVLEDGTLFVGSTLVLTGDAEQLQDFVLAAFANPAMVGRDTSVFVRDRPELGGPPPP